MNLETTLQDGRSLVRVVGEVDVHTAPLLEQELSRLYESGAKHLAVDLDGVDFMDSTGLRVLLVAQRQAGEQAGSFEVRTTSARLLRLFEISGVAERLTIVPAPSRS